MGTKTPSTQPQLPPLYVRVSTCQLRARLRIADQSPLAAYALLLGRTLVLAARLDALPSAAHAVAEPTVRLGTCAAIKMDVDTLGLHKGISPGPADETYHLHVYLIGSMHREAHAVHHDLLRCFLVARFYGSNVGYVQQYEAMTSWRQITRGPDRATAEARIKPDWVRTAGGREGGDIIVQDAAVARCTGFVAAGCVAALRVVVDALAVA